MTFSKRARIFFAAFGLMSISAGVAGSALAQLESQQTVDESTKKQLREHSDNAAREFFQKRFELEAKAPNESLFYNPAYKDSLTKEIAPLLQEMILMLEQRLASDPNQSTYGGPNALFRIEGERGVRLSLVGYLAALGIPSATAEIEQSLQSTDPAISFGARVIKFKENWYKTELAGEDQTANIREASALAKLNGGSIMLSSQLATVYQNTTESSKYRDMLADEAIFKMGTPRAKSMRTAIEGERVLKQNINKPIVLADTDISGKSFSTDDWKGKVIIVDFWATWCGPCRGKFPKLVEFYNKNHEKGVELVGISCDNSVNRVQQFIKDNPQISWPQLAVNTGRNSHPIADKYGVGRLPTMFVIDKKGILRSTDADKNYEELVAKLLAE